VDAGSPVTPLDPVSQPTRITVTDIYMKENVPWFKLDIVDIIWYGIQELI